MSRALVVIGGGGFGREVLDVIDDVNLQVEQAGAPAYEVVGILDDGHVDEQLLKPYNVTHLGPVSLLADMADDVEYVIGIGSPPVRARIDSAFKTSRRSPALVHSSATIGAAVELGDGTVVCAGVRITNHIRVGRHVHLNLNCTVGHDSTLGDYFTASPLCAISGNVTAGEEVFLGTGATINPGVTLGAGSTIGSGGVVLGDIPVGVTAVGVPAKPR